MSLYDSLDDSQKKEYDWRMAQLAKCGAYTGDICPNCNRSRIMNGDDGKRRCEQCAWCLEDNDYDIELSDYFSYFL